MHTVTVHTQLPPHVAHSPCPMVSTVLVMAVRALLQTLTLSTRPSKPYLETSWFGFSD